MDFVIRILLWAIALPIMLIIWPIVLSICVTLAAVASDEDSGKKPSERIIKLFLLSILIWTIGIGIQVPIIIGLVWLFGILPDMLNSVIKLLNRVFIDYQAVQQRLLGFLFFLR